MRWLRILCYPLGTGTGVVMMMFIAALIATTSGWTSSLVSDGAPVGCERARHAFASVLLHALTSELRLRRLINAIFLVITPCACWRRCCSESRADLLINGEADDDDDDNDDDAFARVFLTLPPPFLVTVFTISTTR